MPRSFKIFTIVVGLGLGCGSGRGFFETHAAETPLPERGLNGALVICGGGRLPDSVRDRFVELAGGKTARLVIIPTASEDEDLAEDSRELVELWKARQPASVEILHTRAHEVANSPEFSGPIRQATGVWISGGRQSQLAAAYSGTNVEKELHALLQRGGVIGGTSAGAAIMSRRMIVRGELHPVPGLGLLPGTVIDQHFLARNRKPRLLKVLEAFPDLVGLGIDEGTALIVNKESLSALGDSTVTICVVASKDRKGTASVLQSGEQTTFAALRALGASRIRSTPATPP